jgi:integrase
MSKRHPYLIRTVSRHGKVAYYCWRRPGPKIRIRGEYGSREFMAAYRAALFGEQAAEQPARDKGSISYLVSAYYRSASWGRLSEATKRQRRNIFDRIQQYAGDVQAHLLEASDIKRRRDELGPGAAKHFVQTMRGLYQWAKEQGYVDHDPTEGVKVSRPKTDGFETWTEADIAAYRSRWPRGGRERLWLEILLHTGLRRGDACSLGPVHIKAGSIEFTATKTNTPVILPLAPELAEIIAASPIGKETFIATIHGKPMSKEFFGNLFREACDKARVKKSAHGLRKAAAVRLAEAGATVPELNAVFGWTDGKMATLYVRQADRERLARSAMERLKK